MNLKIIIFSLTLSGSLNAQWIQVLSPAPYEHLDLTTLYFINDSVGYAGNDNSSIVTYDGGRSWSVNPGFTDLIKACYVDSLNGFGITETNFYQTTDGGVNWVSIRDSVDISRFSILESANGKVFVVGNNSMQGPGLWYVSDDVGASWQMRHQQDSIIFFQGRFLDDQNIFSTAISHFFHPNNTRMMIHFMKSEDGGQTWQTYDFHPSTNMQTGYSMFCPDKDTCFTTHAFYGGLGGPPSYSIHQLDFISNDEWFIYGQQVGLGFLEGFNRSLFIGGYDFLKVSPDRGLTWIDQNISFLTGQQKWLGRCHVFNDSSAVITGGGGVIIRTDNFGLGLKEANSPQPSFSVYPNPSTKGYQEITLAGITPHTT
ncbi:MAG: hypothetical protein LAT54_09440, partial [Cryomorphaceae bacterium]|nr:hypothetical protein [Cryomorphaceae bacterium]